MSSASTLVLLEVSGLAQCLAGCAPATEDNMCVRTHIPASLAACQPRSRRRRSWVQTGPDG